MRPSLREDADGSSYICRLVLGILLNITFGFLSHIVPAQLLMVLGCLGTAVSCLLSAIMDTSASYWTYNFFAVALSVIGPDFVVSIFSPNNLCQEACLECFARCTCLGTARVYLTFGVCVSSSPLVQCTAVRSLVHPSKRSRAAFSTPSLVSIAALPSLPLRPLCFFMQLLYAEEQSEC
jgi:hypothetical protein